MFISPRPFREVSTLTASPLFQLFLIIALCLPLTRAHADAENSATTLASVSDELRSGWYPQSGDASAAANTVADSVADASDADHLYGNRIRKLTDYIEENFAVEEARAFSIVTHAMEHGKRRGLTPELVLAVIAVESGFQADARSSQGAQGLMQIIARYHPETISEIGGRGALMTPEKNIQAGTKILVQYLNDSDGNLIKALGRYNGSSGKRSRAYANKVLSVYRQLKDVS